MNLTSTLLGLSLFFPLVFSSFGAFNFEKIDESDTPFNIFTDANYETNLVSPTPSPSSQTIQPSNNLSGSEDASRTRSLDSSSAVMQSKKRKRFYSAEDYRMSIDEIIEQEVSRSLLRTPEKRAQLRNTLHLISLNDYDKFMEDLPNFKKVFEFDLHSFKRAKDILVVLYIFMFGSYNILLALRNRFIKITEDVVPYFTYLVETKPFETIIRVLTSYRNFVYAEGVVNSLKQVLFGRYSNLSEFQKYTFDLVGDTKICNSALQLCMLNPPKTAEDFGTVTQMTTPYEIYHNSADFLCKFLKDKKEFYRSESLEHYLKFQFIKAMLFKDDVEGLFNVLVMDPKMIEYAGPSTGRYSEAINSTVLLEALNFKSLKCLDALLESFPELATMTCKRVMNPIQKLIWGECDESVYQIFHKWGFGPGFTTHLFDQPMNLLQAAFAHHNFTAFKFYVSKVGNENAREMIYAIWANNEAILSTVFNRFTVASILYVAHLFDINLNSIFTHNSREGNAVVFMDCRSRIHPSLSNAEAIGLDTSMPVYNVNQLSGIKTLDLNWYSFVDGQYQI